MRKGYFFIENFQLSSIDERVENKICYNFCHNKRSPYNNLFYHRRPFKTLFTEKSSNSL